MRHNVQMHRVTTRGERENPSDVIYMKTYAGGGRTAQGWSAGEAEATQMPKRRTRENMCLWRTVARGGKSHRAQEVRRTQCKSSSV